MLSYSWQYIVIGCQARLGNKNAKENIVAVFFGDGATDTGTFWESINYACLENLPILFVCEDNGLAVHTQDKYRRGYKNIFDVLGKFNCDVYE